MSDAATLWREAFDRRGSSTDGEAAATEQGASLAEVADPEDRAVALALVEHERALCEFARRELAGDAPAAEPIPALAHVAART